MNRFALVLAGLIVLVAARAAYARVEADPNKEYAVTPAQGPWMICAASFTTGKDITGKDIGDPGQMAHNLVLELRSRYDLPAFIFNRSAELRKAQEAEIEQRRQAQAKWLRDNGYTVDVPFRARKVRIEDQYAVLIGGYPDIETARRALEYVRHLETPKSVPTASVLTSIVDPGDKDKPRTEETAINPFATSFVVPNPSAPPAKPTGQDPFLKRLNENEGYSLLQCKKHWTLVVKNFEGACVVQPQAAPTNFLDKLLGNNPGVMLDAGAQQAHEVARVLRESPGFRLEAYVLHTRYGSIVTVGSYDSMNDPKLLQNQKYLANLQLGPAVKLFARPLPMEVPKVD